MKPFIQIFDVISIPSYNLLAGLGIVTGMLFFERDARRYLKDPTDYYLPVVITVILSFGGAVLLQWYLESGIHRGGAGFGMTFYGGVDNRCCGLFNYLPRHWKGRAVFTEPFHAITCYCTCLWTHRLFPRGMLLRQPFRYNTGGCLSRRFSSVDALWSNADPSCTAL